MGVILSPSQKPHDRARIDGSDGVFKAWRALGVIGAGFVFMGSADLFLAWYPASFGTVEWEFGAISASLNGMALPSLGLFLVLACAIGESRPVLTRVIAITMAILVVVVLALAVVYATDAPVAVGAISGNPAVLSTLKKSIVKSSTLFLVYVALFSFGAVHGWRASRPMSTG